MMIQVYGRIYLMTCLANNKKYIGQTVQSLRARFRSHFNNAKHPGNKDFYLHRALRKHGKEGFQILSLCVCQNQKELDLMEDLYILLYDALNPDKGYNSKRGGGNGKFSEESRKRCSVSKTGLKHSLESRQKRSESFRGIKNPQFGKKLDLQTRQKMSQSRSGVRSYKYRQDVITQDLIHLYETHTTTEIAEMFHIDPSTVSDRLKKAGASLRPSGRRPKFQAKALR